MSLQLAFVNLVLRSVGRPLIKQSKTPERARRDFDRASRLIFRGPRSNARETVLGRIPCLDVTPSEAMPDAALLYLHGGGYITGSPRTHLAMVGKLARRAKLRAVIPEYRRAPEFPFPAAFEDALSAWKGLRKTGLRPESIVIGGDSAGGGLALALLAFLLSSGERPAGLFAFSPWTDMTLSGKSLSENARSDVILPVERIGELRELVAPGADFSDPRLSPLFARFDGAPPILLQASESEILRDDTLRLEAKLRASGVDVRVELWPDTPHAWQLFCGWLPEADDALEQAADFAVGRLRSLRPRS